MRDKVTKGGSNRQMIEWRREGLKSHEMGPMAGLLFVEGRYEVTRRRPNRTEGIGPAREVRGHKTRIQ